MENQNENSIKNFGTARDGKYFLLEFDVYDEEHHIVHKRTTVYNPQQNGLAERKNRTLVDMINTMTLNAKLPSHL